MTDPHKIWIEQCEAAQPTTGLAIGYLDEPSSSRACRKPDLSISLARGSDELCSSKLGCGLAAGQAGSSKVDLGVQHLTNAA